MHSAVSSLTIVLAIAALIVAIGKFIDDYHIRNDIKSSARNHLINWYLWLDARKIPDFAGWVLQSTKKLINLRRFTLLIISVLLSVWAIISAFYIGRELFGPPNTESYFIYLINWIPLGSEAIYWIKFLFSVLFFGLLGLLILTYNFHRASLEQSDIKRILRIIVGLLLGSIISLIGAGVSMFLFAGGGYVIANNIIASLSSLVLPFFVALVTFFLIVIRNVIHALRWLLMHLFDSASAPTVSPFTYTFTLIGVFVLAFKVVEILLINN